ncbi:MAG: acetylornithine deacetylase [Pseudomonadota bacterium]
MELMEKIYTPTQMLAKLVGFNTESHRSNLDLIEFVEAYLAEHGVQATRVPDETNEKAALYAHIGPLVENGVVLSGHTDVVPVEGQDWRTDPYVLTAQDGKLFGRGTCDMKGFLAICLAAVPEMLAAPLNRPIQLALSYDEEVGCIGAPPMIAAMGGHLPRANSAIIGEPTEMKVVTGHKAITDMSTAVRGFEMHSSLMDRSVSAVMAAAELVQWCSDRVRENAGSPDPDSPYDPPFTTLHVGQITGGTAHNITARDCRFTTDIRAIPREDIHDWITRFKDAAQALETRLQTIRPEAAVTVTVRNTVPGCRPENDGPAEALARAITGDNGQHVVSYATEAGQFQDAGYSAAICGPGSIEQAHQPNEFIKVSELEAGRSFISRLIERMSA